MKRWSRAQVLALDAWNRNNDRARRAYHEDTKCRDGSWAQLGTHGDHGVPVEVCACAECLP